MAVIPPSGRVMALDWGTSRIGVAISDETQLVATPLVTVRRRTGRRLPLRDLLDVIDRESPVGLVVGLPLDDNGLEGPAAIAARDMGGSVSARRPLPVEWIDESFTTADTLRTLRETGTGASLGVDASAAATMLQHWLNGRR
ncbi:MAG TPA: Holliday junction resolvase RuvX [Gemmatimonadales bacterium]|jgi:putative Holliday junction resolvase